jgi:hypothetical protein
MSKERAGYVRRLDARTPIVAGSSANCTCASWESRGANDMARMSRDRRYAPQLATWSTATPC